MTTLSFLHLKENGWEVEQERGGGGRRGKLQLANHNTHMLMVNLFSSGAPHIHIFPSSVTIMLVVWSTNSDSSALPRRVSMSVRDHKCVILQAKKTRCALNKEILDLLNEVHMDIKTHSLLIYHLVFSKSAFQLQRSAAKDF